MRTPLSSSGSLLVVTLWLVTILSVLAIAIARYLSIEVRLTKYRETRERTKALARGGVYLAMQRLSQDAQAEPFDWLGDDWAAVPGADAEQPTTWVIFTDEAPTDAANRSRVEIQITDMQRSINLNAATEATLAGPELTGSAEMAKAIVDDRDPPEDSETTSGDPPYDPKNGLFAVVEELLDIPGMADVFPRLSQLAFATLDEAPARPSININTAQRDVLLALGADANVAEALVAKRPGIDGVWGTEDDCIAKNLQTAAQELADCAFGVGHPTAVQDVQTLLGLPTAQVTVSSSVFRIQSQAFVGSPSVTRRIEAVVRRPIQQGQDSTMEMLSWREG